VFGFSFHRLQLNDLASAVLILLALTVVIHLTQLFSRVDNLIFDYGQKVTIITAPEDVIIIAIDQASLSQIGRWPWSRTVHANLLQRLKSEQPAAIGLDVIFAEPEQANPIADALLSKAIAESGKVVLPVLLETVRANGQVIETLPLPAFMQHAADVGRVHAVLDEDSIARSVYLHEGIGEPVWQLFSQAVLNVATNQKTQNKFTADAVETNVNAFGLARENQRRINFSSPSNHFNSISYTQVLSDDFPRGLFTNKIVLVGATALGMNDLLTTPVSGLSTPMAGVEFHANVLQSIRTNKLIYLVTPYISLLILLTLSVMPLLWLPKTSALVGFLSTLLFMGFIALVAGLLPTFSGFWLPPSATLVSLLLAYPIWSWRKLEAAQRFLDFELDYLKQNMAALPDQTLNPSFDGYDQFDARIAQVRSATQQLRFLNAERKETLAFISHDLRAPIAGALYELEQHQEAKEKLHKPLSQALNLAEDFLHVSRAEMMDNTAFDELDFTGLVHQAIDDAYDAATEKQIVLARNIIQGVVWVNGNFGLLHRAMLNLILNAVKYAPDQTEIKVGVDLNDEQTQVMCSVSNKGAGIRIAVQEDLFKRFSRLKKHDKQPNGAGLGLYFVRTVAEKHHGSVGVESDVGVMTTFKLQLPVVGCLVGDT
jgi:CHASE2 domain-containing sensor protein/two-component sensor histidine kinase